MRDIIGTRARRLALVTRFVTRVFPLVDQELDRWRGHISEAEDRELSAQGLASIRTKRFHCQGGSIYALAGQAGQELISFIVALQTISDYLDNLCDRSGCLDAGAFRQLHTAFTDALEPGGELNDYYRFFPHREDGGYLTALVEECRNILCLLPSYPTVKEDALWLGRLYCDLQTYKHTHLHLREDLLREWFADHSGEFPGLESLEWWEFAAATGSTLGIFALCAAAGQPGLTAADARRITAGYFPWICGLHILLDYFIDQDEDQAGGDLNFVSYYADAVRRRERLVFFMRRALREAAALPNPHFHTTVVLGLPAFYLSDPKVRSQGLDDTASLLLSAGGRESRGMYRFCKILRSTRKI